MDTLTKSRFAIRSERLLPRETAWKDHVVPKRPTRPSVAIADDLRRRITAGEWDHEEQLPVMTELARHYDVARATVARAIKVLEAEGLVTVVPAWGVFRT